MAVVQTRMTEAEFMRLPADGRKYELVDGEAKEVPAGMRHDEIGAIIIYRLTPYTRGRGSLCGAQAGFRMTNGNVRAPDVSFTRKERLPQGQAPVGFGDAAPDLAVEVISPSEDAADTFRKLGEYFEAGAQQVWLVEPQTRTATVYRSLLDVTTLQAENDIDGGDLLPGFHCRVAQLFTLD